jgi:hypothetical protein
MRGANEGMGYDDGQGTIVSRNTHGSYNVRDNNTGLVTTFTPSNSG